MFTVFTHLAYRAVGGRVGAVWVLDWLAVYAGWVPFSLDRDAGRAGAVTPVVLLDAWEVRTADESPHG